MKTLIWIIDDEWSDYDIEFELFKEHLENYTVHISRPEELEHDLKLFGKDADAILSQISVKMTKDIINKLTRCKIISNYGTGYNNIDLTAAHEKGIAVGYIPGYCAQDIADYVAGAVYYHNRPLDSFAPGMHEGLWGAQSVSTPVHRISSQKALVIGLGRIGEAVVKRLKGLGLQVMAFSPSGADKRAEKLGIPAVALEEGLRLADYVSVHLKYCADTEKYIGYEHFCKMKKSACFINTARGGVIDQAGLVKAVSEGKIARAILDVLCKEPPEPDDPVLNTEGILVTPHISYYSVEALSELQLRAAKNAVLVLKRQAGADLVQNL